MCLGFSYGRELIWSFHRDESLGRGFRICIWKRELVSIWGFHVVVHLWVDLGFPSEWEFGD